MTKENQPHIDQTPTQAKPLSDVAQRALEEAAQRRLKRENDTICSEHNGPKGAEPTRFGDWERKGIAYDF
jgi:hypothetical protein